MGHVDPRKKDLRKASMEMGTQLPSWEYTGDNFFQRHRKRSCLVSLFVWLDSKFRGTRCHSRILKKVLAAFFCRVNRDPSVLLIDRQEFPKWTNQYFYRPEISATFVFALPDIYQPFSV